MHTNFSFFGISVQTQTRRATMAECRCCCCCYLLLLLVAACCSSFCWCAVVVLILCFFCAVVFCFWSCFPSFRPVVASALSGAVAAAVCQSCLVLIPKVEINLRIIDVLILISVYFTAAMLVRTQLSSERRIAIFARRAFVTFAWLRHSRLRTYTYGSSTYLLILQ